MTAAKPEQDLEGLRIRLEKTGFYEQLISLHESVHTDQYCFCTTEITPAYRELLRLVQAEVAAVLNHLASPSSLEDSKSYGEWVTFEIQAMLAELHPPQQPPTEGGTSDVSTMATES